MSIVLVHGMGGTERTWEEVAPLLEAAGHAVVSVNNELKTLSGDVASTVEAIASLEPPVVLAGHSYGGAVITNAATDAENVVGLVYVAAFAPDEGETLGAVEAGSKDSVLNSALVPLKYPSRDGTAVEFAIHPDKIHEAFAADLPAEQTALMAATQRPVAETAFSEPSGPPAWKRLPSWTVVATGDKAAGTDVVRSQAERAGAAITEVEGSHVIMISQPQAVTEVIVEALAVVRAPARVA
jgi:pimeloyl-ACP methyl ester carboxylesterase